jgi:hypothetical protein
VAGFISTFRLSEALFEGSDPVFAVTFNRIPLLKEMVDEVWARPSVSCKANRTVTIRMQIRRWAAMKRSSYS